ncbi:hypothetical protein [Microbacterium ulmi]|uniref:Uncharacterized protein n=1 Tax=Microbacterium ulmi TaxID=179095 RepID=A0A7Y2LXM5_9MICO|nr:hypothetical protein [Microbacterium ulmi]NII70697.1 hypothetical protein [Microbacterium ulmi]NNH02716.1 hypothetical protein [Microbacterium ulmi]
MTSTSRLLNRAVLLLLGVAAGAAGLAGLLAGAQPAWASAWTAWLARLSDAIADRYDASTVALPDGTSVSALVLIVLAAGIVLAALLAVFVFTRGRGASRTVLRVADERGATSADRSVAESLLAGPIDARPDVLSARARVFRVKGAPAVELAVVVRRGADLVRVLTAAEQVASDWDALMGVRVPVLVHLTGRTPLVAAGSRTRVR